MCGRPRLNPEISLKTRLMRQSSAPRGRSALPLPIMLTEFPAIADGSYRPFG